MGCHGSALAESVNTASEICPAPAASLFHHVKPDGKVYLLESGDEPNNSVRDARRETDDCYR